MTQKTKRLLAIILIAVLFLGICVGSYFLFIKKYDQSMRVKDIGGEELRKADFKNSKLYVYPYGAFEVELVQTFGTGDVLLFSGIGTYEKSKTEYTFVYIDYYSPEIVEINPTCQIVSGKIRFEFGGNLYYFGK